MARNKTILAFCLVCVMIILGAKSLLYNLSPMFDVIDKQIENGETIVMNGKINADSLKKLLLDGDYLTDPKDAEFISQWYKHKIESGNALKNLGAINGERFKIPADTIRNLGGEYLKTRLAGDNEKLGQNEEWRKLDKSKLHTTYGVKSDSTALIQVYVGESSEKKTFGVIPTKKPVSNVTVRLTEHWINNSVPSTKLSTMHDSKTIAYTVTDENGIATFYAPKGRYYSVVPIAEGYQYGQEKGTINNAPLNGDLSLLSFNQKEQKLRPFSGATYSNLKKDKALVSRTPSEFSNKVVFGIAVFLGCWILVLVVTSVIDKRFGKNTDTTLLLALMILSGMGLLTQYGQMMPLTDIFNADNMINIFNLRVNNFSGGIVIGCLLLILLSSVDYLKLYHRYMSRYTRSMGFGKNAMKNLKPGLPFVVVAVLLMVMLQIFGSGPEGSDAHVNLFGVQPSEIVKYLMVFFMAFFFTMQGDVIKTFGAKLTTLARRRYIFIIGGVIIVIAVVCFLFLAMLKDMGPGIVILATFILLYSVARRDLPQLLLGIVSYVAIVGGAYLITDMVAARLIAVLAWFVLWIMYSWVKKKTVYESAIFFNVLVSLFLVGGHLIRPFLPHMAERLDNRTGMAWSGIFDNAIPQGDQIAQGLWGTASGGLSGMGLGGGSPYFIPAGHTDLILNSLGEQMGWIGILIVVICFYILISRTAMAAQYSGHKFTFYLCLGLGLITGVQFLFIALGCVGAIPLSGVPVPLMSYSGTSIAMALAAFGIVVSISRHRGSPEALKTFVVNERRDRDNFENIEAKSLNKNLFAGLLLLFVGCISVVAINGYYQLMVADKTKLRPAITSTNEGLLVLDYNPRIGQILRMLDRGNIFDRNGVLLATSDKEELSVIDSIKTEAKIELPSIKGKRLKRYYPFGNNTVFMVGDINRPDVYSNYGKAPTGYFAENQNADVLQGFQTNSSIKNDTMPKYKLSRFVKPIEYTVSYREYDYSVLLPALATSIYRNPWIEEYNASRKTRDVHLTIDAVLQTKLQERMDTHIKESELFRKFPDLRASVVVLDAKSGELLTSANYPLPVTDSIVRLRELDLYRYNVPSEGRVGSPITERDLGLTFQSAPGSTAKVMTAMAGLKKNGAAAYNQGFEIKPYMNVEKPNAEPNTDTGNKNRNGGRATFMEDAIKWSSNCYFILSLNENDLYSELGNIYWNVGASLSKIVPYFFDYKDASDSTKFNDNIRLFRTKGLQDYEKYMKTKGALPVTTRWGANSNRLSSIQAYTGIAWGQSLLEASPLNMARVAGIVGNDGVLMPTRFLLNQPKENGVRILDSSLNDLLFSAMNGEASKHSFPGSISGFMGGKTGTPNRDRWFRDKGMTMNDGWYICCIRNAADGRILSIALRLERLSSGLFDENSVRANSGAAVAFMKNVVLPVLGEFNYIEY